MTGFRASVSALIAASVFCALLTAPGCGTDAQGISDCRSIERERCVAAANCGDSRGGKVVDDVDSCQRFYRDQCLHGTTTASPGAPQVDACVRAIRAAGECAAATPDTQESLCVAPINPGNACDAILSPERLTDCRFLSPDPNQVGEGGAPGATAGAGGQGNGSSVDGEGGTPGATAGAGGVSGG
jgi:hypothetical protein